MLFWLWLSSFIVIFFLIGLGRHRDYYETCTKSDLCFLNAFCTGILGAMVFALTLPMITGHSYVKESKHLDGPVQIVHNPGDTEDIYTYFINGKKYVRAEGDVDLKHGRANRFEIISHHPNPWFAPYTDNSDYPTLIIKAG